MSNETDDDPLGINVSDDADTEAANGSAVDRMRRRINELDGKGEDPEVSPPDDEYDDELGPRVMLSEPEEEEEPSRRKQKKQERWDDLNRRAEAAERRAAEAEARSNALAEAAMRRLSQPQESVSQDPHEEEMDKIFKEQKYLYNEFQALGASATEEQVEAYESKARALDRKKVRLEAEKVIEERGLRPHDPNESTTAMLRAQFNDVLSDPRAARWARGYHEQRVSEGRPDDFSLVQESMNAARQKFGMGSPAPRQRTEASRRRHAGTRATGTPNAEGPKSIVMTKAYQAMARATYPNLPENEAMKRWANGPGRRMLENQ